MRAEHWEDDVVVKVAAKFFVFLGSARIGVKRGALDGPRMACVVCGRGHCHARNQSDQVDTPGPRPVASSWEDPLNAADVSYRLVLGKRAKQARPASDSHNLAGILE